MFIIKLIEFTNKNFSIYVFVRKESKIRNKNFCLKALDYIFMQNVTNRLNY